MSPTEPTSFIDVPIADDDIEQWIEKYLRKRLPQLEQQYRRGWEGFKKVKRSARFDADAVEAVEEAASSNYAALWKAGSNWLRHLEQLA